MTYEHIVQCAKCGAFGQFERGHQCEPVSYASAIVPDTLQHIGGGCECVDAWPWYGKCIGEWWGLDIFGYADWLEGIYQTEGWPDAIVYADREGKAE